MRISKLSIRNFKGIRERADIDLRKITVVVGANSSGKSSVLHGIGCLGQTAKLPTDDRPIMLDDERADIHLGRFIEVIHTKRYSDDVGLGICIDDAPYPVPHEKTRLSEKHGTLCTFFKYGCTKRTQDVYLSGAEFSLPEFSYSLKKHGDGFIATRSDLRKGRLFKDLNRLPMEASRLFMSMMGSGEDPMDYVPLIQVNQVVSRALSEVRYLGPFRMSPMRTYPTHGAQPKEVGPRGEFTVSMLANEVIQSRNRVHIEQIAEWLRHLGIGSQVKLSRVAGSHHFDLGVVLNDSKKFPLADLGYGTSQVLPVLTQCSFAPDSSTLLFEQPELHLHSVSARKLAKVFIDTVANKDRTCLIETHSPELVKEFLQSIAGGLLSIDDFVLYKAERMDSQTQLTQIDIEKDAEGIDVVENWEKGISV